MACPSRRMPAARSSASPSEATVRSPDSVADERLADATFAVDELVAEAPAVA